MKGKRGRAKRDAAENEKRILYILGPIVAQDSRNAAKAYQSAGNTRANKFPRGIPPPPLPPRYTARNPIRIGERGAGVGRRGILLENCGRSGNIRAPPVRRVKRAYSSPSNYARAKS